MSQSRDVWRIHRAGSLDRLSRETEPLPDLGQGQVRIAVEAIGLNFADVFACLGLYSATPHGPFVPGLEFAGTVEAVGPTSGPEGAHAAAVPGPGTRVMGVTRFGAFASRLDVDGRLVRRAPEGWTPAQAAAFPVQALTAWYGLSVLGRVAAGDVVLVHSAAGGVGLNALAILRAREARVIATVGRPDKRDFLAGQGFLAPEQIVVRDRRRFGAQLDAVLGACGARGFDIVFDAIAGPYFRPAFDRLRPEGRHVIYGAADFMPRGARPDYLRLGLKYLRRPRLDPMALIAENRSVSGFNLIWLWDEVERLPAAFDALDALITAPPLVGHRFGFRDLPAALRTLQAGDTVGKVVVDV